MLRNFVSTATFLLLLPCSLSCRHSPLNDEKAPRVEQDATKVSAKIVPLESRLRAHGNLELAEKWKAKIWIAKIDKSQRKKFPDNATWLNYNAVYEDTDKDGAMNPNDAGFFEPGSTVKVAVAATYLEKHAVPDEAARKHLQDMLVVSDNDATNALIADVSFVNLNAGVKQHGISNHIVSRYMMKPRGDVDLGCQEVQGIPGNCASAQALQNVLLRVVHPEWFVANEQFKISESERAWILGRMAALPAELGYKEPDESCRLLQRSYVTLSAQHQFSSVYVKCGVSPKNNHWTELSYVKTEGNIDLAIVFSVAATAKEDEEIYQVMNKIALPILTEALTK